MGDHEKENKPETDGQGSGPIPPEAEPNKHAKKDDEKDKK